MSCQSVNSYVRAYFYWFEIGIHIVVFLNVLRYWCADFSFLANLEESQIFSSFSLR